MASKPHVAMEISMFLEYNEKYCRAICLQQPKESRYPSKHMAYANMELEDV